MENLIFSLNATLPIFLLMMVGYFFRRLSIVDEVFATRLNSFVFNIALPVSLFSELYSINFTEVWDTRYVLYCFVTTSLSILIAALISRFLKDKSIRGEFVQAAYRSSASLLGMAYIQLIYGHAALGSLMMIGSVPLYNVMAVIILSTTGNEKNGLDKGTLQRTFLKIVTNPIILGIAIGFVWSILRIPMPTFADTTISYIGALATPLGLISMGARLEFGKMFGRLRPALVASFLKLFGFVALFIPVAVMMGFTGEKLVAALIMLGSASTVAGYIMAKNMGHEGTLAASVVMLTTLMSSFSLTFWIWLLRSMGLI